MKAKDLTMNVEWAYADIRRKSHAFVIGPLPPNHALCGRWIHEKAWSRCEAKCKLCLKKVQAGGYRQGASDATKI